MIQIVLAVAALLVFVPVTTLFVETLAAAFGSEADLKIANARRLRLAILVPAHNEALVIAATLRSIRSQLQASDRLLVVADNCSDDTGLIAADEGAEVITRSDEGRRGKGYALDYGIRHLESNVPEVVIVMDADCVAAPDTIDKLVRVCADRGRPVQSLYLMHAPDGADLRLRVAQFAWVVRNHVRPLGLRKMNLPCQLMGTGMAFPWSQIQAARLATGHIVEDLKLGIDCAFAGAAPVFCPQALVTSCFPSSGAAVRSQRERWEHGHLSVILGQAPRAIIRSLRSWDPDLLAIALDLSVPPLALLTAAVVIVWCICLVSLRWSEVGVGFLVSSVALTMLGSAVSIAWVRFGRAIISMRELASAPLYALWKIPLYIKFVVARQAKWIRSDRENVPRIKR